MRFVGSTDDVAWQARIDKCVAAIDAWERRTAGDESPHADSPLARDDSDNPSLPASMIAWGSIGSAVDHLGLAVDSMRRGGGGALRPMAFYTACRSALVAGSQAVWVMSGNRASRLHRARLLEVEEARTRHAFLGDFADDDQLRSVLEPALLDGLRKEREKARNEWMAAKRREKEARPAKWTGESNDTRRLREAAEVINEGQDPWLRRAFAAEWRLASGDAHARLWPRLLRPGESIPLVGTGTKLRITTATLESYGVSLGAATMATSTAWRLWDERRVAEKNPHG
jgi:hypothetical protein